MPIDDSESFTVGVGSSPRLQKMSICYGGNLSYASAQQYIAQHFDLLDCNPDYGTPISNVKALNPNIRIIGYHDLIMENPEWADWATVNANEPWFVHTTAGERIRSVRWGGYLMKPMSGWTGYFTQRAITSLQNYPLYDGVFADDAIYDLRDDPQWDHPLSDFETGIVNNWPSLMLSHVQYVKSTMDATTPDKMLMPNPWKYTQFCEIAGAMLWENFIHNESQSPDTIGYSGSYSWGCLAINLLHEQADAGRIIATHSGCKKSSYAQEYDWLQFCYCCNLLAVTDVTKSYFCWHFYGQSTSSPIVNGYHPVMDTNIGQPVQDYTGNIQSSALQVHAHPSGGDCGSYSYCGGVFVREFENYYIVVNISPSFSTAYDYSGVLPDGTPYTVKARKSLLIER